MRLTGNAQIAVLQGSNRRNPFAMYITEILETEGFCYQLVEKPAQGCDLLILPDIELTADESEEIKQFAQAGGCLLALRPSTDLLPLFGLRAQGGSWSFTWSDLYLRLREDSVLQYHGPADLTQLSGADALSYLQHDFVGAPSKHPAVVRYEDSGRRAAFTFDLSRSTVLFHQGRSDQAGDGTNPDPDGDRMFKPNDLFINYLDPRCKLVPQADMLQDLLVELICWLTEKRSPIPRLWHFPEAQPAVAFISGDSDGAPAADDHLAFEIAESFGIKYTLYLMTQDFDRLSREEVRSLTERGHDVSLHPWVNGTPTVPQFREGLTAEFAGFRERYGSVPATVRNHSCIIAGWVDTPAIFSEIGLRMDLNPYSIRGFQYGYLTGTGLPVRYMHRQGHLIDLYQQATLTSDDALLETKCNLPAHTLDEAIRVSLGLLDSLCEKYHGVYQPCFHPIRLKTCPPPAIEWYKAMLGAIRSRNILSVSGAEWCAFNDARRTVKIKRRNDGWHISADKPVRGLTLLWPERVTTVIINHQPQAVRMVNWGGIKSRLVTVDVKPDATLGMSIKF